MTTSERIVGLSEDLTPNLSYCNKNKAPLFLNLLALGRTRKIGSTIIAWTDYSCKDTQTVTTEALTESGTVIKIENKDVFTVGSLARIGDEVVLVTAIDSTTGALTVTRGQHGTTAEAFDIGEEVFYINDNVSEGADFQGAAYKGGINKNNVTQIFREEIGVSGTASAVTLPSGNGVDAYELEKTKGIDLVIGRIEKALISGVQFQQGDTRGLGGLKQFLEDGQIVDAGGTELSYSTLNELARKVTSAGGDLTDEGYAFYVSPVQSVKMSSLLKNYIKLSPTDQVLGGVVSAVATPFGTVPVIVSNNVRADEIILTNHNDLEIAGLREITHQYLGQQGDSTKGLIVGELSLEVRQIHRQGKIENLSR